MSWPKPATVDHVVGDSAVSVLQKGNDTDRSSGIDRGNDSQSSSRRYVVTATFRALSVMSVNSETFVPAVETTSEATATP